MENVIAKMEVGGVKYSIVVPSGLTPEQQAQIRTNIGAISAAEADVVSNGTYLEMTVGNATHAQTADNATNAVNAQKATADANGNNIPNTYLTKADWLTQEHPVGSHHIQFNGEATPAARFGGTWEIDTDYTGRVLIGSGTGFALGAMGGSDTHNHTPGELGARISIGSTGDIYIEYMASPYGDSFNYHSGTTGNAGEVSIKNGEVARIVGVTGAASSMQPYKVVAVWKRTA